jgi:hypothetical protein
MHPLTPLRWMSYMLIALGLINWRYQSDQAGIVRNTAVIVAIGLLQLIATFAPGTRDLFMRPPLKVVAWIISIATVAFAIFN